MLVDGAVVGIFTPSSTAYQGYLTAAFTVTAGSHTIKFQGLDSAGGDNTAFLDAVAVAPALPAVLADQGLRAGACGGRPLPVPAGWLTLGLLWRRRYLRQQQRLYLRQSAGPSRAQVAFLQQTGSFSQSVAGWAAGRYVISFDAAQRGNIQASREDFQVLVDGAVVGIFTPSSTAYQGYLTAAFSVTAGSHTIKFQGLDSAGGDNTAFIDDVNVYFA